jgi:hypothetical protein
LVLVAGFALSVGAYGATGAAAAVFAAAAVTALGFALMTRARLSEDQGSRGA